MFAKLIELVVRSPRWVILIAAALTVYFALQLPKLRWETDARVYMPKGHPAILYDEKVEHVYGAKDAVIIAIANEEQSIFNPETLARIARVTEKVAALPGVVANRVIDVASLSTASVFEGTDEAIGTRRLMPTVPQTEAEIQLLRDQVFADPDLFVGNLISPDGKAAMIRAKLKEGIANRYETYFRIKGIIAAETGEWDSNNWSGGSGNAGAAGGEEDWKKWQSGGAASGAPNTTEPVSPTTGSMGDGAGAQPEATAPLSSTGGSAAAGGGNWPSQQGAWPTQDNASSTSTGIKDKFYLAGRPVVEVTSGLEALTDLRVMVPTLLVVTATVLWLVFRAWAGVFIPLLVMAMSVVWTMGAMGALDVPLYTISTMLPVILVAVGIGDGIHVLSHYYDHVLEDPQRDAPNIVRDVMGPLGAPLAVTSLTTAIGFLTLWFAEMPPFKVFGLFTVLGIAVCWLLTVTLVPAILSLLKPKVGGYLQKRQSLRVREEQGGIARAVVDLGAWVNGNGRKLGVGLGVLCALAVLGAAKLQVDSSWLSDFRKDSDLVIANTLINEKFSGTIKLHVIIDGKKEGALKSAALLKAIEDVQAHAETLPYVGDSLSVVDYLKSMNKTLHAGDEAYDKLPETDEQIAEYLFLFSISGRPEELDEVVDFNYSQANVTVMIRTDQTLALRNILDKIRQFAAQRFQGTDVEVNFAGSANNSYLWADLLIDSQTTSIVLSKIAIAVLAILLFQSFAYGLLVVIPVTLTTLFIGGVAGWVGIPLDVSTALAAGVAIGVGVDYAVHYLFRYRRARRIQQDHSAATRETMRSVGKTIVFNALVVTGGFAVLFFSVFPPHVKLGYFVAAYMVLSCAAALLILPALTRLVKRPADAAS